MARGAIRLEPPALLDEIHLCGARIKSKNVWTRYKKNRTKTDTVVYYACGTCVATKTSGDHEVSMGNKCISVGR